MIKKLILFYFILFFVPLAFAELNNSEINIFAQGVNYVVIMFTFGSQGSLTEGVYESRFITTGIETGSSHAQGELYLANVGFLGNSSSLEVTPAPTPTPVTTPTTAVGGGGGAVIVPECLEVSKEFRRLGDYELLDILFRLETREISKPEDLVALIDFESFGTIPAKINYNLIISQKNKEVYSEDGKLTVETSETLRKTFDNLVLKKGFYNMQFNVVYGEGVSEDFNTDFEVIKSFSFVDKVKDFIVKYLTWPIIFLLLLFIFIKLKRRFKKKQKIKR